MLYKILQKIKFKILRWLYKELKYLDNIEKPIPNEKQYYDFAIIGSNTQFSKAARIYNHLNDKCRIKIGNNCVIYGDILIYGHGGLVEIGDFVFIGENSRIWSSVSIKIGNNVLISHNVNIHDNNSHPLDSQTRKEQSEIILTRGLPNTSFGIKEERILIEDDVWIGYNASISKGVTLGKGSIIGAGTYVFHDVPPYSIVMGNPSKIISKTQ